VRGAHGRCCARLSRAKSAITRKAASDVFAAAAIAESVLAVLAWWMFRRGTWKLKVV